MPEQIVAKLHEIKIGQGNVLTACREAGATEKSYYLWRRKYGDMTYVPTWAGFLYLAVVVGWAFGERITSYLLIVALNMAVHTRRPESVSITVTKAVNTPAWRLASGARRWV